MNSNRNTRNSPPPSPDERTLSPANRETFREVAKFLASHIQGGAASFMESTMVFVTQLDIPIGDDDIPDGPGRRTINRWLDMINGAEQTNELSRRIKRLSMDILRIMRDSDPNENDGGTCTPDVEAWSEFFEQFMQNEEDRNFYENVLTRLRSLRDYCNRPRNVDENSNLGYGGAGVEENSSFEDSDESSDDEDEN